MRPIEELSQVEASGIRAVFTDIDGTITDATGRIPSSVFAAMERVRDAGLQVVPITGRPAGWCDMIARTWPVDGVVGENGGLWFRLGDGTDGPRRMLRGWALPEEQRRAGRVRLRELGEQVLGMHRGAALASDQQYREFDLAIDFCEDVAPLPEAEVDDIVRFLAAAGCQVKVSNIHVNAWFGSFDKATMCRRYAREVWGWDVDGDGARRAVFFGDSPNDAPLFALFPLSIGVANVRRMAARIDPLPPFVTRGEGSLGFVEGLDAILARSSRPA